MDIHDLQHRPSPLEMRYYDLKLQLTTYCESLQYMPGSARHKKFIINLTNARQTYITFFVNKDAPNASGEYVLKLRNLYCSVLWRLIISGHAFDEWRKDRNAVSDYKRSIASNRAIYSINKFDELCTPFTAHFKDEYLAIEKLHKCGNLTDIANQLLCAFFPGIQRLVNAGQFVSISLLDLLQLFECFKLSMLHLSNLNLYVEENTIEHNNIITL